jgi:hypothetical protein
MKFIVIRKNAVYKSKEEITSKSNLMQNSGIGFRSKKPKQVVSAF